MKCRKNFKRLTADEKKRFVDAFVKLADSTLHDSVLMPGMMSRYGDYPMTHMNAMMGGNAWAHGNSSFLPWHRELLYQFEKDLQAIDSSVMLPYWDWTREQSSADSGFPFQHNFIGVDGTDAESDRVKRESGAPSPYPYPFDPEVWPIEMKDSSAWPDFLTRAFGERGDAPNLPENDTAVTGTSTTFRSAIGTADYLLLRSRSESLHNLVHRWVGGSMLGMTSPNDPVFFLHHAQIDRMWSLWQGKNPGGVNYYVADAGGTALNSPMIFNESGETAPWSGSATPNDVINGHAMHGDGVWYDTDLPEIDSPDPSLDFIGIPEGLTTYKAVKFKIKGCRQVRFRITGAPTGQFGLTPMGTEFIADPIESDDFFYGYVWVQFVSVPGTIANSSVNIQAYIIDDEGYYASSEGGEFSLGNYSVTLTATTVAREDNSIALVLDRSGSMAAPAGGTSTRSQLLSNAIDVFRTLMLPGDEVAVITFDNIVDTPISMQAVSGAPSFSTVDLTPRGSTWIGGGIESGAVELAAASHTNKSMIVLTDGNENVHPYIAELPSGTITNRTYAIGFGLPGEVSDVALNQITSNTDGDMIITGNMSSSEQQFNLTKYFVQILAGVSNSDVILDPNGKLFYGSKDVIPFKVTEADVYMDVICLCPLPAYIDFFILTPGGKLIRPGTAEPNVKYIAGRQVTCYRMVLPALAADHAGSHAGTWKALVALKSKREVARLMQNKENSNRKVSPKLNGFLPYSLVVHATSNLQFKAWKLQESFKPGAAITLFASLKEYDINLANKATVWAEVTDPKQNKFQLYLNKNADGVYTGTYTTIMAGNYHFRIHAEGYSSKGMTFIREKMLTAGVYFGNYEPLPQRDHREFLCSLIECIFKEHKVISDKAIKKLNELGFDMKLFIECLEEVCKEIPKEVIPGIKYKLLEAALRNPQFASSVKFKSARRSRAVKHEPKSNKKSRQMFSTMTLKKEDTMFMQFDLPKEEKKSKPATGKNKQSKRNHSNH